MNMLQSIFLGSPGKLSVFNTKIKFDDHLTAREKPGNKFFYLATFTNLHLFLNAIGEACAYKLLGGHKQKITIYTRDHDVVSDSDTPIDTERAGKIVDSIISIAVVCFTAIFLPSYISVPFSAAFLIGCLNANFFTWRF